MTQVNEQSSIRINETIISDTKNIETHSKDNKKR